jgi:hypothetical protein
MMQEMSRITLSQNYGNANDQKSIQSKIPRQSTAYPTAGSPAIRSLQAPPSPGLPTKAVCGEKSSSQACERKFIPHKGLAVGLNVRGLICFASNS